MVRILQLIFVALFLVTCTLPGLQVAYRVVTAQEERQSSEENRRLRRFEQIPARMRGAEDYLPRLPTYMQRAFDDQMAIRVPLTGLVNSALVYGFGRETGEGVSIGDDGYWFQTEPPTFAHLACAAPAGVNERFRETLVEVFSGFSDRMEERGIETFLAIIPKKSTINPSLLPGYLEDRCIDSPAPASFVFERLGERGVNVAYDVDWFQQVGIDPLFERRSYHWHHGGGMQYGEFLFNEGFLSSLGQSAIPVRSDRSVIDTDRIDLASRMGVGETPYSYVRPAYGEDLSAITDGVELLENDNIDYSGFMNNQRSLRNLRITQGREGAGRALILGDSFSRQINLYLARHFEEALVTRTNFMGRQLRPGQMDALVDQFQPDYVILVFIETKFAPVDPDDGLNIISSFLPADERIARNNWRIRD